MAKETPRTVSVTGTGTATAAADKATVSMSIVARSPELDAAQRAAAEVTARVLELTDSLEIDRKLVDTTGAGVRPDYRWNREKEEQELRGYIAERQMVVKVEDLELLGRLIEGAVGAGVNQVSPPQLDSNEREEAYRQALRRAAIDARESADVLAKTLDARIGDVITINAGSNRPPQPGPQLRVTAMAMESDASATYNPADLTFSATVDVVFELTE
ncbi:MAG: SIMPL domain-containing protein [Gammaproteobacteria bacterium]|nr:SIMPL domain-containing protein [Gammaproteobacteria bacterium]